MTSRTRAFVQHGPHGSLYWTPANYHTWWPNQRRGRLDGIGEVTPAEANAIRTYSVWNTVFSTGIGMLIGYAIWGKR